MGSFGERLRREREMRGVTLDEISASTKIARRHLEALETENFDSLPGGVFNRGFVRSYARFLGIDEEQAVADYVVASGEQSRPEPNYVEEIHQQAEPKLNPRRSSLPLLLALLALVIVLAIFWARNKRQPEMSETPPAATPTLPPPTPAQSAALSTVSPSPQSPVAASASLPAENAAAMPAKISSADDAASASKPPERTFSITVRAKEEAWINAIADGKTVIDNRTLQAGQQQLVRAGKKIILLTGNAGGIDVSFNGKPLGPLGNESERRELTFTPAGLVQ